MRENPFAELYTIRGWGDWQTPRQGLSNGMDLLDWMRFVLCATWVIRQDENPQRRLHKAERLYSKAMKVWQSGWIVNRFPAHIETLIRETQKELEAQK